MFTLKSQHCLTYMGNFGKVGELGKFAKLKTCQLKLNASVPVTLSIQIAKFKFRNTN